MTNGVPIAIPEIFYKQIQTAIDNGAQIVKLEEASGLSINSLIDLFAAGWKLSPPKDGE